MNLEDVYDHLQWLLENPRNLLHSDEEFEQFLNIPATREDLICFRESCVKNELYEWAAKVNLKIREINEIF